MWSWCTPQALCLVTLCISLQLGVSILWLYQALYTSGLSCCLCLPGCGTCFIYPFRSLSIISICFVPRRLKLLWAARWEICSLALCGSTDRKHQQEIGNGVGQEKSEAGVSIQQRPPFQTLGSHCSCQPVPTAGLSSSGFWQPFLPLPLQA